MSNRSALLAEFLVVISESTDCDSLLTLIPELEEEWDERQDECFASIRSQQSDYVLLPTLKRIALEVAPMYFDC